MPNTISAKFSHVVIIFIRIPISILYLFCVYAFYLVCVYFIPGGKLEREEALNMCRDTTNTNSQYCFQYPKCDQYYLLKPTPIFHSDQHNFSIPLPISYKPPIWPIPLVNTTSNILLRPIQPIPFVSTSSNILWKQDQYQFDQYHLSLFRYQPCKTLKVLMSFLSHTLLSPGVKQPYIRTAEGANGAFGTCCKMRHSWEQNINHNSC